MKAYRSLALGAFSTLVACGSGISSVGNAGEGSGSTTQGTTGGDMPGETGARGSESTGRPTGGMTPIEPDLGSTSCPQGEQRCGGACVDTSSNPNHCGDCGQSCVVGSACSFGECVECAAGEVGCEGRCIAPEIDEEFCGASNLCLEDDAGEVCRAEEACLERRCVGWETPTPIDTGGDSVSTVEAAINDQGDLVVAFIVAGRVWARWQSANAAEWTDAILVSEANQTAIGLGVDIDESANARFIWSSREDWHYRGVRSRRVGPGGTSGSFERVSDASGYFRGVLGIDDRGNSLAVTAVGPGGEELVRAHHRPSSAAGHHTVVLGHEEWRNLGLQVAMASDGSAVVTWEELSGEELFFAARYRPGAGTWDEPELIRTRSGPSDYDVPTPAVNASGDALLTWSGAEDELIVLRSESGGAWGEPEVIASNARGAQQVVIDSRGNALVWWKDLETDDSFVRRFDRESRRWAPPIALATDEGPGTLALAPDGSAFAIWNGEQHLQWRRYDAASNAWSSQHAFEHPASDLASGGRLLWAGVDATGRAAAVWRSDATSSGRIWSARFR